jgi:NhaC family Na+:H+ antiporter
MSALTAGISVFDHIRSMIPNTIFAAGIALVGYTILGFMTTPADGGITPEVLKIISDLESIYNFNILIMLIPAIIIFGGAHLKLSPVILMTTSAIAAGIIGVVINGFSVESMYIALTKGFNVEMIAEIGLDPSSISEGILPLLNRGGMYKMMSGAFLITVLATVFGAFMERVGCLDKLLGGLHKLIKGPRSLINTTFVSGALFHAGTSGGTFGILTIGNLFKKSFDDENLEPSLLSRVLENSITLTMPFIPFSNTGIYMAQTLGVSTVEYIPWLFYNVIAIVSYLLIFAPRGIKKSKQNICLKGQEN